MGECGGGDVLLMLLLSEAKSGGRIQGERTSTEHQQRRAGALGVGGAFDGPPKQ